MRSSSTVRLAADTGCTLPRVPYPVRVRLYSKRSRHTRCSRDWSSDVCSSDLPRRQGREGLGSRGEGGDVVPDALLLKIALLDGDVDGRVGDGQQIAELDYILLRARRGRRQEPEPYHNDQSGAPHHSQPTLPLALHRPSLLF